MRQKVLFITLIAFFAMTRLFGGDTLHIRTHDKEHWGGYGEVDKRVKFPDKSKTYRKIILHYTLGCPGKNCSGWDYTTKIDLVHPTGYVELARVITPYGSYYNSAWKFTWDIDVTDFEPLLHDSNTIRAFYSGWTDGFSITLDFDFIEGTPPVKIVSIDPLFQSGMSGYGYKNGDAFDSLFPTKTLTLSNLTRTVKSTFTISGHGFDNNRGSAEFDSNVYLSVNSSTGLGYSQRIWRNDCGMNALYHQSGTWLFDRANWCPGDIVHPYTFKLGANPMPTTDKIKVDASFTKFVWTGKQAPSYYVDALAFSMADPNFTTDASLEDIISPSDKSPYGRLNPICGTAEILISNQGKDALTSVDIYYGPSKSTPSKFTWTGNLGFQEYTKIKLPYSTDWIFKGDNQFVVRLANPNNKNDEQPDNDKLVSNYTLVPDYPNLFFVYLYTNKNASENKWEIIDGFGKVVKSRANMVNTTLYVDTIALKSGCYTFNLYDEGKDGLEFWANDANTGIGQINLRKATVSGGMGLVMRNFEADFGTMISHQFTVGNGVGIDAFALNPSQINIYPNPASKDINIEIKGNDIHSGVMISLVNMEGQTVISGNYSLSDNKMNIHLPNLSNGMYFMSLHVNGQIVHKKVLINN